MTLLNGATIESYVYVVDNAHEKLLLGKEDAPQLGIISLNLDGAQSEVHYNDAEVMNHISWLKKTPAPTTGVISGWQTQAEIDESMRALTNTFPRLFQDKTSKFKGHPIKIQLHPNAMPVIQPPCRIPLHHMEPLEKVLNNMIRDDIIEGPLEVKEPGTYISNLVITDKKWDQSEKKICITLDCQAANKNIYQTRACLYQ